jgi:hypothetical protein
VKSTQENQEYIKGVDGSLIRSSKLNNLAPSTNRGRKIGDTAKRNHHLWTLSKRTTARVNLMGSSLQFKTFLTITLRWDITSIQFRKIVNGLQKKIADFINIQGGNGYFGILEGRLANRKRGLSMILPNYHVLIDCELSPKQQLALQKWADKNGVESIDTRGIPTNEDDIRIRKYLLKNDPDTGKYFDAKPQHMPYDWSDCNIPVVIKSKDFLTHKIPPTVSVPKYILSSISRRAHCFKILHLNQFHRSLLEIDILNNQQECHELEHLNWEINCPDPASNEMEPSPLAPSISTFQACCRRLKLVACILLISVICTINFALSNTPHFMKTRENGVQQHYWISRWNILSEGGGARLPYL